MGDLTELTDAQLAAIAERAAKATGTAWFWNSYHQIGAKVPRGHPLEYDDGLTSICWIDQGPGQRFGDSLTRPESVANADFIAEARSDIPALLASHTALAARLAEAEQTIVQRVATIHGLMKIVERHEAEMEDLAQRCDKATAQLTAAQATIARLTTALETIRDVGMDEQGITRTTTVASAIECERIARAALAPPTPVADDV